MYEDSQATSPSLLHRLRNGDDETAWAEFVEVYWGLVHDFAQARGCDETLARDIAQETLVTFVTESARFQYDHTRGRFRTYLLTIARHAIVDRQRRQRHYREPATMDGKTKRSWLAEVPDEDAAAAGDEWDRRWRRHLLRLALDRVEQRVAPRTWQAFRLYVLEERPADEVCAALDLNRNTLYQQRNRLLKLVRREVDALCFELGETP